MTKLERQNKEIKKLKAELRELWIVVHSLVEKTNIQDLSGNLVEVKDEEEEEGFRTPIGFKQAPQKKAKKKVRRK